MTKTCSICGLDKNYSDFNKKGSGLQSKCRDCQREWYSNYYHNQSAEKQRLKKNNFERKIRIREWLQERKSVPCADCGIMYPYFVMDFDHRDPSQKLFNIGSKVSSMSFEQVRVEVEKCDVVCSNCHRIRTHSFRIGGNGKPT